MLYSESGYDQNSAVAVNIRKPSTQPSRLSPLQTLHLNRIIAESLLELHYLKQNKKRAHRHDVLPRT